MFCTSTPGCLCCSRCWSLLTSVRSSMAVVAALVVGPVGGDHGGLIDQPLPVASAAQGMASSRCCRSVHRWTEKRQSSARRVLLVPEAGAGCCGRALGRTGGLEGVVWSVQDEQRGCRGGRQAPVSAKPPDPHLWLCKCGEANSVSHRPAPPALDVGPVGGDPGGWLRRPLPGAGGTGPDEHPFY